MKETVSSLCPQCQCNLSAIFGEDKLEQLSFCPQCQFPLALIANKYRFLKKIGQGGFGTVYLAQHVALRRDQERVVKLLKPDIFKVPGMEERFYREVQLTSSVARNNEHIVRIYDDFGKHPQLGYFYVMEYLEGRPLSSLLQPTGTRLPLDLSLHIFRQLCDAIDTAHQEQIIHRDLKPDNIFLIQRKTEENFVKVLDFGIAKPLDQTGLAQTQLTHGALGTPLYMAPEQWSNQPVDGRIDIYAMGLLLYQMLTGYLPFPAEKPNMSMQDLVAAHLHFAPRSFAQVAPDVDFPAMLEPTVLKALHKDPSKRYPTAKAFWHALEGLGHSTTGLAPARTAAHIDGPSPAISTEASPHQERDDASTVGFDESPPAHHPSLASTSLPTPEEHKTSLPTAESTNTLTPEEQEAIPDTTTSKPNSRHVGLLSLSLVGCLALLGGLLWWHTSRKDGAVPITKNPTRVSPLRPRPRQAEQNKAPTRTRQPRQRQPRPARRRPMIAPLCPQAPARVRWLYLALSSYKGLKIAHLDGSPPLYKVAKVDGGKCVALTQATSIKITATNRFPCYFPVAFQRGTLTVQLQQSSFDAIEPDARYCIKSKP